MLDLNPEQLRLTELFFPYAFGKYSSALQNQTRFVHYTRAEAGMNILRSKAVWLRKSSCMNDFTEVEHGLKCLIEGYKGEWGQKLKANLDRIHDGISLEIENLFDRWTPHLRWDTYFICLSEHFSTEDTYGRLSMWRAYGADGGVALVMNNKPFMSSVQMGAYSSPVAYLDDKQFPEHLRMIAERIEKEAEFLRAVDRDKVVVAVFNAFRFAAVCTKHPAFFEEQEWRVIHTPAIDPSPHVAKSIESINGVPQAVYKIGLKDIPEKGFFGITIPALIDRIIIGPAQYPIAIRDAFVALLEEAGVSDAGSKVLYSTVPLRR